MERVVPEEQNDDPKDLRTKLTKALKDLADVQAQNAKLTNFQNLTNAGYSHLNDRQQKALFNSFSDTEDKTPDSIKKVAEELGFQPAPAPTPQVPASQVPASDPNQPPIDPMQGFIPQMQPLMEIPSQYPQQQAQVPGQPQPQPQIPGQVPTQVPVPQQNPQIAQAITGLSAAEQAQVLAARHSQSVGGAFDAAMAQAQTPEQVMNVIRNMGAQVGLMDQDMME